MNPSDYIQDIIMKPRLGLSPSLSSLQTRVRENLNGIAGNSEKNFDVIVLGVGSMGSATCYNLAKEGIKILGLEQFDIPHDLGSHAGQSRIIRKAYFEHPDYVPLLEKAYLNWKELENVSGSQVYYKTGLLYTGNKNDVMMKGVRQSASEYKVPVDELSTEEAGKRFHQFSIPDDYDILFEPDAGFLAPEKAIMLYTEQAILNGAVIKTGEKAIEWKIVGNDIKVTTNNASYTCKKLVITAGPWAGKMVPGLSSKLTITRQVIAWVNPKKQEPFGLGHFPCWLIADETKPGAFYGFPSLPVETFGGPMGLKLAYHYPGTVTDPDAVDRTTNQEDEDLLVNALHKFIPEAYKSTYVMKTCLYTNTPDENFILDILPDNDKVVIATGFSGHGFKFVSVVGQVMTDLAIRGKTDLTIDFLKARRFK